jgi:hypothetical protein
VIPANASSPVEIWIASDCFSPVWINTEVMLKAPDEARAAGM